VISYNNIVSNINICERKTAAPFKIPISLLPDSQVSSCCGGEMTENEKISQKQILIIWRILSE